MASIRTMNWDPWQDLETVRSELNRLFGRQPGRPGQGEGGTVPFVRPTIAGEERDDRYLLTLDMPGVPADGLAIEVDGRSLRIQGERGAEGEPVHVRYERVLMLPENA